MKKIIIGFAILAVLTGLFIFNKNRKNILMYHLARVYLLGDRTKSYEFTKEDFKSFPNRRGTNEFKIKWYFRPSARIVDYLGPASSYYPETPVEDTDKDGVPEVYVSSYSRYVYCLNGITGELLWKYKLPFGFTGGATTQLFDIDKDGKKEVLVGTHEPMPLRVYCIKTGKISGNRLMWAANVFGDFIEGGLMAFNEPDSTVRVAVASRRAPYTEGALTVLNDKGRVINEPTKSLDVCMARPTVFFTDENDGLLYVGCHDYTDAYYRDSVIAKDIESGDVVWQRYLGWDTGYEPCPIIDYDFDGKKELIVLTSKDVEPRFNMVLDPLTGDILDSIPFIFKGSFRHDGDVYILGADKQWNLHCYNLSKRREEYVLKGDFSAVRFVLDIDNDSRPELVYEAHDDDHIRVNIYDLITGKIENTLTLENNFDALKPVKAGYYDNHVLADTDGDGYWEFITLINGYVVCFDMPYKVKNIYSGNYLMPFGSPDGMGTFLYYEDEKRQNV